MELFIAYLKWHRKLIIAFILFCAVFAFTFILYQIPLRAVLYPALLCAIIAAGFIAADFSRVKSAHKRLSEIKELTAAMISSLPEAESIESADYQEIISNLQNEVAELETNSLSRLQDTIEYYTVWVHQIKTPIAAMHLTLQNEDTPLARRLSSDLLRIEQYVEMVLAYLRLDADQSDYVFKSSDIDGIIKQALSKFASEFIDRKLRLEYEEINLSVVTDEKWLTFVIEQILSNALKYTREGSIKIYMSEKKLCIEDTGIGIAPEDLPRVFEKGYTGYNGRLDKKASGIGLYLCRRICQNLGMEISVTSEPQKGTAVYIDLEQYRLKKE